MSIVCCHGFDLSKATAYYSNSEVPSVIKEFAPNASDVCQIDSDITFKVHGFLYITKKLCDIESNIAINCPDVQYSVRLGIINESKDDPLLLYDFNIRADTTPIQTKCSATRASVEFLQTPNEIRFEGLGMFLRTNQYPKLKLIHQHIEKELENKPYILIPVSLKINNVVLGHLASVPYNFGLFDIEEILPLSEQEKQKILEQKCKIDSRDIDTNDINYCKGDMSDDRIYPFAKDLYVNMREEPNAQSKVIARLASVAPKGEEYVDFTAGEISLSEDKFSVFGYLLPISIHERGVDINDVNNLSWLVNRAKFLRDNPDVKIVKAETISLLKNYGFVDNEQVELYVAKSLPINSWYKVYFIDKMGKKIGGYIHKSQLSWGF